MRTIVIQPVITEKSMINASKGLYTFRVVKDAPKEVLKKEIESLYNVHVKDITTTKLPGKVKRAGRRMATVTKPVRRKAIVRLAKDEKIAVFETIANGAQG